MKRSYLAAIIAVISLFMGAVTAYSGWNTTYMSPQNDLEDVYFLPTNINIGYAAGKSSLIVKSTDGGVTWSKVNIGITGFTADFNAIWFIDNNVGFAAGDAGKCIKTTNAGSSWTEVNLSTSKNINDIFFGSGTQGVIVGDEGLLKYTLDAGANWQNSNYVTNENINAVYLYTGMSGFAVGDNRTILETGSTGSSWAKDILSLNIVDYNGITISNGNNIVVCGDGGTIITSSNQGNDWVEQVSGTTEDLYAATHDPDNKAYFVAGNNGTILKSAGNFSSFLPNNVSANDDFRGITMVSEDVGFAVGSSGAISRTIDAGDGLSTSITINAPADNSVWIRKSILNINWTSINVNNFIIQYSLDGGNSYTVIDTVSNTNTYAWQLPDTISNQCKIKISDADNLAFYALSAGLFTISSPNITVLSPNGGERWNMNSMKKITWDAGTGIATVAIEFSSDNGNSWNPIASGINASLGEYSWKVNDVPTSQYKIRIKNDANHYDYDESNRPFAVLGVMLTSFNDGANYLYETEHEITWQSLLVDKLNILLSTDNGATWEIIEENYPASLSSYTWTLPKQPADQCLIRLIDPANSIYMDESEQPFTISGIVLTSPLGGETWLSGTEHEITWESSEIDNVMIEYTPNEGDDWITIISHTAAAAGSYTWTVPKTPGYRCWVRISDVDATKINDVSNEFFTISGSGIFVVEPNGGEEFEVGDIVDITWASASVNNVNIYYSTDAGNNWHLIADSVDKDAVPHQWIIPNTITPSTECLIKVTDTDNETILDSSDTYFRIKNLSTYYKTPESWNFASHTGSNSTIILPSHINPLINGDPIETGDAVGVFYNRDGNMYCAGYAVWNNSNMSITVWGDDPQTALKDGFETNETYRIRVWDAQEGVEIDVDVEYSSGLPYFTEDGISIISVFDNHKTLKIPLRKGWSMISSNIVPKDTDIDVVMNNVIDNMEFMKNEDGEVFYPDEAINALENWETELGYQIYMNEEDSLFVSGVKAVTTVHTKFLNALQWHIIAYIPQEPMAIDSALKRLDSLIIMVKNSDGEVFYPDYNIDEIGIMNPTEGYKIITKVDTTLTYVATPDEAPKANKTKNTDRVLSNNDLNYIEFESPRTGNTAVIVVESDELKVGDEIGVYTQDNILCGAGKFNGSEAVITVHGDNSQTPAKEGALNSERLLLKKVDKNKDHALRNLSNKNMITQNGIDNLIYFEDAILGTKVDFDPISSIKDNQDEIKVSPQPASNLLTVETLFSMDKISLMDMKGEVLVIEKPAGITYIFDLNIDQIASGSYILMIHSREHTYTKKVIISK